MTTCPGCPGDGYVRCCLTNSRVTTPNKAPATVMVELVPKLAAQIMAAMRRDGITGCDAETQDEWETFVLAPAITAALSALPAGDYAGLVEAEREACAKVADEYASDENGRAYDKRQAGRDDNFNCARASAAMHIAAAIRARSIQDGGSD